DAGGREGRPDRPAARDDAPRSTGPGRPASAAGLAAMILHRRGTIATLLVVALAVSGCSTVSKLNPFKGKDEGPLEQAGEGQRISIIPADQRLEVAEALKGVEFSLPEATKMAEWPLPGGTPENAPGNVDAA